MVAPIIVVSGLPRSGTSMMMQVLEATGVPLLCDDVRKADEDNPKGYYEYEPVKRIAEDSNWVPRARGKAVKVISPLLQHLPVGERYRVILMRRDLDEVLASQAAMIRCGGGDEEDAGLRAAYQSHLQEVRVWLTRNPSTEVAEIEHRDLVQRRAGLEALVDWLPAGQDLPHLMGLVDRTLYRQRKDGLPGRQRERGDKG